MIYDVERLEADLSAAWSEWQEAVAAQYTPHTDMDARRAKEGKLFDRASNLQRALQGIRSGFYHINDEGRREMSEFLEAYKLEGSA